jgi:hypothetical protein
MYRDACNNLVDFRLLHQSQIAISAVCWHRICGEAPACNFLPERNCGGADEEGSRISFAGLKDFPLSSHYPIEADTQPG